MPNSALPPHLRGKLHWDWPWPLSRIPRGWTSFNWGAPKKILGSQKEQRFDGESGRWAPSPIGEAGSWQLSYYPAAPWWAKATGLAFYFARSGKRSTDGRYRHVRLGTRWDDVDDYATILTVATRKFTGGNEQDTSTR